MFLVRFFPSIAPFFFLDFSTCAAIYYTVGNYHRLRQKLSDFVQRPKDVDHLRLLSIAHSKNIKSRRFGVRAIGGLVNLQDWKIMQISQFSEPPVIAALMLKGVPLEKFLKPIVPLTDKVEKNGRKMK